jgi:hypothetical protein
MHSLRSWRPLPPLLLWALLPAVAGAADVTRVTESIEVAAGERVGDLSTVNGSIRAGQSATLGSARTVTGSVTFDRQVTAQEASTVNGSIHVDEQAHVSGDLRTVNGSVTVASGADIGGRIGNVNGQISVAGAHVGGGIGTVGGNIQLGPGAHVDGGIHVGRVNPESADNHVPLIVIGPNSVVSGALRFERNVRLYVSAEATIGPVEGANAIRFTGPEPPQ